MSATVQPNIHHAASPHKHASATAPHGLAAPALYQGRHPEQSLLYRTIAAHFETWLALAGSGQFDGQGDLHTPAPYVEQAFRKYLECGIFAFGFARARCDDCGHDFLVAFSCKGRGVCPSCNTRHMVETAAHLTDHIFPRLPVRQWVLTLPKRLRYFLQNDAEALNTALRIFLRVIHASLYRHCPSAAELDQCTCHLGACAFIHRCRSCSSLNTRLHFHVCVVDGVFEARDDGTGVIFHAASGIDAAAYDQAQNEAKRRIVRAFVKRGLLDGIDGEAMLSARHGGGFSVDASVCIDGGDRAGLERLLQDNKFVRASTVCHGKVVSQRQRSARLPLPQAAIRRQARRSRPHAIRTDRQNRCTGSRRRAPIGIATSACWPRIRLCARR